ncbi:MAG TPA: SagB family peptide dehydrogenase [Candidatus Limnocylindrales bacterium]|jgi:SagB-type dehydrogenase family enzyme
MTRLRHDLDFLTSAGLLLSAIATAATGLIADLWDLNDFWYHTISGYVMGGFAIVHVTLNWQRLVSYGRFRIGRLVGRAASTSHQPTPSPTRTLHPPRPAPAASARAIVFSRRGLLGMAAGGVGGWLMGRGLRVAPPIEAGSDVGVVYHQWSKPGLIDALGTVANWGQAPPLYKEYPGATRRLLPDPGLDGGLSASQAIVRRRSIRAYIGTPMTSEELSKVLFLTSGVNADSHGNARRTAPSSGALYPIEVYAVVHNVADVAPGVYHYAYRDHALELIRVGDHRQAVVDQGIGQEFLGQCGAVLFLTMILQRMRPKYQDRSYRYGLLEAGHIGENAYLAATSMGLGACGIGAFMDDQINAMLGVDGVDEAAVYMLAVGHRSAAA